MAAEFYMIDGVPLYEKASMYKDHLEYLRSRGQKTNWIVLAVYKDFKNGIINHFIVKEDKKGNMNFYVRKYVSEYQDNLRYDDWLYDNEYLPGEEEIYNMLKE